MRFRLANGVGANQGGQQLGDGIGNLFRSENRKRVKTNLLVFLRPVVMRDAESAARFSNGRYEQIRAQQQDKQPAPSVVLPINESPVLPARPAASAPAP